LPYSIREFGVVYQHYLPTIRHKNYFSLIEPNENQGVKEAVNHLNENVIPI
jgi:hypothetical protein